MKSKVYVSVYLVKGKKIKGIKRDVMVLASADESDVSRPRPPKEVILDRADEVGAKATVKAAINDYIASLPDPTRVSGIVHRTHCHGLPVRAQYGVFGARRAPVMGPIPLTEEARFAIEEVAEERKIACDSARDLKGPALKAAEDFLAKVGFGEVNSGEKRALMLALKIKSGSYEERISTLQKRFDRVAARRERVARKVRLKVVA